MRVPYNQLTEEEKTQDWFSDVSAQKLGTIPEWAATALQKLSGTSLKVSGKEHSFEGHCHWEELQAVYLPFHFAWKEK